MQRCRTIALIAVLCTATVAGAVPMGTGTLYVEYDGDALNNTTCSRTYGFANTVYDVFGTNVNLSTDLVEIVCSGSTVGGVAQPGGGCASYPSSSIFAFNVAAHTVCLNPPTCNQFSFVTDAATNVTGTLPASIGSDVFYTGDGELTFTGTGAVTIPNCPIVNPVAKFSGPVGINAFQGETTVTGVDQTVSFPDTTFFNPITGQTVPIDVDINFAQVTGSGSTIVTATSNAAGEIPSNFAFAVNNFQAAFLDISTTADVLPPFVICSSYQDSAPDDGFVDNTSPLIPESALSFLHGEGDPIEFVDRTSSRDTVNNIICATTDTLSPFAVLVRTNGICASQGDPCDDGNACTENDACDVSLECVGGNAVVCPDDGSVCTSEVCVSPAGCTTQPAPAAICNTSNDKALLLIKNDTGNDAKDQVLLKWLKGNSPLSDFGDPTATTGYTLCAYDANKTLVSAGVPAAGPWSFTGPTGTPNGVLYSDPTRANDGVKIIKGKADDTTGKAKVLFKALGTNLTPIDVAAIEYPVKVQLRTDDAFCWEQQFTVADQKKNSGTFFKALHIEP